VAAGAWHKSRSLPIHEIRPQDLLLEPPATNAHCAGDYVVATLSYARVLRRSPHHVGAILLLSTIAQDAGDWAAAKELVDWACSQSESSTLAARDVALLVQVYLARGLADLALATIIWVERGPPPSDLSVMRARIKAEQQKLVGCLPSDDKCATFSSSVRCMSIRLRS